MEPAFKAQTLNVRLASIQSKPSTKVRVLAEHLASKSPKYDVVSWTESLKAPVQNNHFRQNGRIVEHSSGWLFVALSGEKLKWNIKWISNQLLDNDRQEKLNLKNPLSHN